MRVLVSTPAALGHLQPMVPLARALRDRGHELLWATAADGVDEVASAGLTGISAYDAIPIGPALAFERYPELQQLRPEDRPREMFGKLWGAIVASAALRGLLSVARDWQPDLVLCDAADLAGHLVAAALGVPSVTKGFGPLLPAERVAAAAAEVAPLWEAHGLEPRPFGGAYDTLYLDPYPPLPSEPAPHIRRRQLIRPEGEHGSLPAGTEAPIPDAPAGTPLVYVTLGTVFNDVRPLRVAVDGVAALPCRVLVTVGPKADPSSLGALPPGVRVERYVPQNAVLERCDAVVCHGGSGTTLGALSHGVPLVCLPQGADQFLNAAAVHRAGAGVMIGPEHATMAEITKAVRAVLKEPSYRTAARTVGESIAAMPSAEDVAIVLESLRS